jgi:hypothetical protein
MSISTSASIRHQAAVISSSLTQAIVSPYANTVASAAPGGGPGPAKDPAQQPAGPRMPSPARPLSAGDGARAAAALRELSLSLSDPSLIELALAMGCNDSETRSKVSDAKSQRENRLQAEAKKVKDEMKAWNAQHSSDILSKIVIALSAVTAVISGGSTLVGAITTAITEGLTTFLAGKGAEEAAKQVVTQAVKEAIKQSTLGAVAEGLTAAKAVVIATEAAAGAAKAGITYEANLAGADASQDKKTLDEARDNLKSVVADIRGLYEAQAKLVEQSTELFEAKRSLSSTVLRG